jgi:hypothetical protein
VPPSRARLALAAGVAAAAALAASAAPAGAASGRIHTVAGAGVFVLPAATIPPPIGDGGPAALARLVFPTDVEALPDGGYLVAEAEGNRIRRVSPAGVIRTIAGQARGGFLGDGGPATAARLDTPVGVAALADGAVAIADQRNSRVRLVEPDGTIRTLAQLTAPDGVAPAADGGVLAVQDLENRVVHVSRAGVVTVVAGTGVRGFAGDGGPATAARLNRPRAVAPAAGGGFLIADGSNRIRRVAADGTITTAAAVDRPAGVAGTSDGSILVTSVNRVLRVAPGGAVTTVAGTGRGNFSGDGGPPADATLWLPRGIAQAAGGGILVAHPVGGGRVRYIDAADPGPAVPGAPRPPAANFRRGIQRGEVAVMTHVRVACPPRGVAMRFVLARRATVSMVVTRYRGGVVARPGARLSAGAHVLRFRAPRVGRHLVRLTAAEGPGRAAHDQAEVSVNPC